MYDTYDILRSNKKLSAQSKEVLLHHALVSYYILRKRTLDLVVLAVTIDFSN